MTALNISKFIPMHKIYMIYKEFEHTLNELNYHSNMTKIKTFHKQYESDIKEIFKITIHSMPEIKMEYNNQVECVKEILTRQNLNMSVWEIHQRAIERTKRKLVYQTYH